MSNPTATTPQLQLPRWQVLVILVGFPLAYWVNAVMPWSYGLFVQRDHSYFIPWGISICVLHWASLAAALWFVRQAGGTPRDIGLHLRARGILLWLLVTIGLGALLIALRVAWPAETAPPDDWRFFYPFTIYERGLFVLMSLSAGFCEEVVYRGFGITVLEHRGWRRWSAIGLSTLSFIMIHGVAALFLFPFLFVAGVLYAALFLWRKSLTPGIYLHTLWDLAGVVAI